jgi:hypothetical protein
MGIEAGFVQLVQSGLGSPPLAPGGFLSQLPKDLLSNGTTMAWVYKSINAEPNYFLDGQDPYTVVKLQLDCHGLTAVDSLTLAAAITKALRGGFSGPLPDADATQCLGIFDQGTNLDGYDAVNRSFVRSLEYEIIFLQP